jgi:hypothetical protein
MTSLTDNEILNALPSEARKKIDSAFEALSQSLPTDKERIILYRIAHALKLNPNDTHFSIMAAMHYYLQLYQMIPEKIARAGEYAVNNARESSRLAQIESAAKFQVELSGAVAKTLNQVASAVAIKSAAKWVVAGVILSGLLTVSTGWISYAKGREAGKAEGYSRSKNEVAAASWANSEEGLLARQLAEAGSISVLATCDEKLGWKLEKNICYPLATAAGTYGWKIHK